MLDTIVRRATQKASLTPEKAVTGPGAAVMSWGVPISNEMRNAQQMMREAQAVYARGNRWVKRAEQTISGRVGSVPWHLETNDGESITDESPDHLRAIRDLFEEPLGTVSADMYLKGQPTTRRGLWGLTSRHMGLCNVGFWYLDEIDRASGWPRRFLFIRPDRMDVHEVSGRFVNWVLDGDGSGNGTPLSAEEVLPFYLDVPDRGYFGTGLVESVFGTLNLPNAIDRHAIDTLGSGGRLPGIYSPKEPGTGDDVFDRMISDLRTIKDMPDSSKRDVVARAPIEFTPTAADMSSLVVTALSSMSRDDTLTHWGVPLSTIGGYTPAGMNSGETRKYDEAALWQNAVQFRLDSMFETIQFRLLDRLQKVGLNIRLVIESPTFDDDSPKYELAKSAESLPLTNKERRAMVGLDPFGDPALDNAVWMPLNIVDHGVAPETEVVEKASLDATLTAVRKVSTDRIKRDIGKVLDDMRADIAGKVRAKADHLSKKPSDSFPWWNEPKWRRELERVLSPHLELAAESVGAKVQTQLGKSGKADVLGSAVLTRLMKSVGKRITGILDTTREDVQRLISQGLNDGLGAAQLGDLIESATTFDEYRAELIARTETAQVLNEAALESYREFGVNRVRAIDGDEDDECRERDGKEYALDEALDISDHPNGTLDWVPIVGAA